MEQVQEIDERFEALLIYLRDSRSVDFTGYKRPSLQRLVQRRMTAAGVSDYAAYMDLLQVEAGELRALLDALLINVTAFFRDPPAWEELRRTLLPEAIAQLGPDEPIRVWSAACASGEEAYSLAILLHELLGDEEYKRRVKIYATDIDEGALQVARAGRFSAEAVAPLTETQRKTYFEHDGDRFVFCSDLRPSLIFGRHDLLQDAPISRVLLLTCRNVLMYFTAETQARVLERFPFALHEHGLLLLGRAEMLLTQSQHFVPVSLAQRIFRARRLAPASRLAALAVGSGAGRDGVLRRATEAAFVATPAAQLVLDSKGTVQLLNDRATRDLHLTRHDVGRQFAALDLSTRPVELRGTVAAVQASREAVDIVEAQWDQGAVRTWWDIRVAPLADHSEVLGVHLVFEDVTERHNLRDRLDQLHQELTTVYEELQTSSEELETTNEELQTAVEELETTNEELQSTNEELQTMNEELQSTNEELQTLNDELRERTFQCDEANGFLQSILEGLDHAVVVIDSDYRVQLWNSGAERLTGLRGFEAEGLQLLDVGLDLPVDELHAVLRGVMVQEKVRDSLSVDITNRFGKPLQRHLTAGALRNRRGEVRGAVISLIDKGSEPAAD